MLNGVPPSASLSTLAHKYDVVLCDVWGVIHDGSAVHPAARDALRRFRELGGSVILLSNASRLSAIVTPELERLGMITGSYDALITSGDITRDLLSMRPGISVFDVGPGSIQGICDGLDVQFTTMQEADIAVAGGTFQDDQEIDQLRPLLNDMLARRLLLLCANPDVVTELGGRRVKCSGALAGIYAEIGGPVYYAGKPHRRIFERALTVAVQLRGVVARDRVLVIGDSIRTDIAGARANGFDSLFVAGGIHAQELGSVSTYKPSALEQLFGESCLTPSATTWRLIW